MWWRIVRILYFSNATLWKSEFRFGFQFFWFGFQPKTWLLFFFCEPVHKFYFIFINRNLFLFKKKSVRFFPFYFGYSVLNQTDSITTILIFWSVYRIDWG